MNEDSPVSEYSCLSEVISEVKEVFITDLVTTSLRFPESYKSLLRPEPVGVYAVGRLEPLVSFEGNNRYWTAETYETHKAYPNITTPEEFIAHQGPIVNQYGHVVNAGWRGARGIVSPTCTFDYSAIHVAATHVWEILRSLNSYVKPTSPLPPAMLDEVYWIKENCIEEYYKLRASLPMHDLSDAVLNFIDRDYFSTYHLELNNTTITVGKGNDFRVISYYRRIFEEHENDRFITRGY